MLSGKKERYDDEGRKINQRVNPDHIFVNPQGNTFFPACFHSFQVDIKDNHQGRHNKSANQDRVHQCQIAQPGQVARDGEVEGEEK